jgi:thymidylate kinase
MTPKLRLIAICGCDASGKTSLVGPLSAALGARPMHHPKPPQGADPWEAACWYASVRAAFVRESEGLWVTDRWIPSTVVMGLAIKDPDLGVLAACEKRRFPRPLVTVLCWAPEAVLDARVLKRGETVSDTDRKIRGAYLNQADYGLWPRVRTDGTKAETLALALEAVRPYLGLEGSDGMPLR